MTEPQEPNVGPRIRALRKEQKLSLQALAELSGLSATAISRIERGENSPTVSSIHRLALALGVALTDLFEKDPEKTTTFVKRAHRPRTITSDGVVMESLGVGLPDQQLEPFLLTIEAAAENTADPLMHYGEEFVYCIEGEVEYRVGDQIYHLQTGDSLLFKADQLHHSHNITQAPAKILLVFQAVRGRHLGLEHHPEVTIYTSRDED
jgi:transcriptional regulator with XRE-family HTH domain